MNPNRQHLPAFRLLKSKAFTLIELIVVVAVFVVLGGILLPALAATHDRSNRAVCQFNLRQIALAVTQYAGDNHDTIFPAALNVIALEFQGSQPVAEVGLSTNGTSIWTCPNRPTLPEFLGNGWLVGYQYYGGITNWINNAGMLPSRSPVKLSQSKPYWMLAADLLAQPDGINWGSTIYASPSGWANLPVHHTADSMLPTGGNEVFCDGSVQWVDAHKMYSFHSWGDPSSGGGSRNIYFYQDISDDAQLIRILPALYRAGITSPGARF
ncbi:MAG TPA: prepilin-type N-terminal cleavage/methylation domain-containing protein [Candidatus Sulfotelmatobacter sp.]|jgi:prepilin-type N-terminal cleavage/methylation domain-containing protein|nr:prepilin-type N-terminal cleavage/methylation domain-containing protein [Candidatus Sulfotelmatobacter sp.]